MERRVVYSPTMGARRNILHFIVVGWYRVLVEAVEQARYYDVFNSKRGRKAMYEANRQLSREVNVLKGSSFPVTHYGSMGSPVAVTRILLSLVKDALYVSHTGKVSGPDRGRRNRLLREWKYLA